MQQGVRLGAERVGRKNRDADVSGRRIAACGQLDEGTFGGGGQAGQAAVGEYGHRLGAGARVARGEHKDTEQDAGEHVRTPENHDGRRCCIAIGHGTMLAEALP